MKYLTIATLRHLAVTPLPVTAVVLLLAWPGFASYVHAEDPAPLATVRALDLDTIRVGRVSAYHASTDREHAERLAALSEKAAAYFERELGVSFPIHLAVLAPENWFVPYAGGDDEPYGMPWAWVDDSLMTAPASLDEGVLIRGSDNDANLRRVKFVLLHEFGHLANKHYLHPDSPRPYSSVRWLEELLATYFAYAFISAQDPEWAETSRGQWIEVVKGYTPDVISLDWSFMRELPPKDFVRTYAWYQNLLNLRAAELYEAHGLDFLRGLRSELPWDDLGQWTTETVMPHLEQLAPGFQEWADALPNDQRAR